uniref:Uncharacterized protein n=1 Tax=Ciona intestinalis TaxID=7719 RepID=F6WA94_CIOIN
MSKKQRDILQRMKNMGKVKKGGQHRNHAKPPEWELQSRKPGPANVAEPGEGGGFVHR